MSVSARSDVLSQAAPLLPTRPGSRTTAGLSRRRYFVGMPHDRAARQCAGPASAPFRKGIRESRLGLSDTRCGGELDTSTEYNLAKALGIRGRDGDMKRVVNLLEVATRRKPQSTANANMLGNAYRRIARVDDAIGQYLHCLAFDPSCLDAHINLIACYQIQGNLAASAKHAREAVRIDPEVKMSADGVGPPIAALVKSLERMGM